MQSSLKVGDRVVSTNPFNESHGELIDISSTGMAVVAYDVTELAVRSSIGIVRFDELRKETLEEKNELDREAKILMQTVTDIEKLTTEDLIPGPDNKYCQECELWKGCSSPFMSMDIADECDVLFVGEAPGRSEDEEGVPFIGASGEMLRSAVEELNVDAAYTNAVRCRPPDNATPTTKQIRLCKPFLLKDIEESDVDVAVLLGNTPLKSVTGYSGITNWRGTPIRDHGVTFIPTYHPAMFLYRQDPQQLDDWIMDLGKASDIVWGVETRAADEGFEYILVDTLEKAEEMFSLLKAQKRCGYDLEFRFLQAFKHENAILVASFAVRDPDKAWALPLFHPDSPFDELEMLDILDMLEEFYADESIKKVGHNVKIDMLIPKALLGVDVRGVDGDTQIMARIENSSAGLRSLKELAGRYLGMHGYESELMRYVAEHPEADYSSGGDYSKIPLDVLWLYAAKDASATLLLEDALFKELNDEEIAYYREVYVPSITTFARMEANGIAPQLDNAEIYKQAYQKRMDELLEEMRKHPAVQILEEEQDGDVYNPNSSMQTSKIVYDLMGYECKVFTATGRKSVASDVIKWISDPWLDLYTEWKLYSSAMSKYLNKIPLWVDDDGRIRSNFIIPGTETFRSASRNPNMQNIPTAAKQPGTLLESNPIKNCFTHTFEGGGLMEADYSAMEMRVMASLSNSKRMIHMFREGLDAHTYVSSMLYGKPMEEVTKPERYRAKWVNWTMLYGGGWPTLVSLYKLPEDEAKELEAGWYAIFPEVAEFYSDSVDTAREHGYSISPFGLRRPAAYIKNAPDNMIRKAEREAANHPVQSGAFSVLLMAMIVIDDLMQKHSMESMLVNTVHDSVIIDYHPDELEELHWLVMDVMQNIALYAEEYFPSMDLSWVKVPLVADADIGTYWGNVVSYKKFIEEKN